MFNANMCVYWSSTKSCSALFPFRSNMRDSVILNVPACANGLCTLARQHQQWRCAGRPSSVVSTWLVLPHQPLLSHRTAFSTRTDSMGRCRMREGFVVGQVSRSFQELSCARRVMFSSGVGANSGSGLTFCRRLGISMVCACASFSCSSHAYV